MVNYQTCSTEALKKFCIDRKLEIPIDHRRPKDSNLKRQDYIRALKKADQSPRGFRFLDLSPDVRNLIYSEVLTFNGSFTCTPQLLATCEQVNNEATGLLYAENLIEVRVWDDGVYAHGIKCGEYDTRKPDFTQLHWPSFLLRAQWVRFSVSKNALGPYAAYRPCALENALFSLCKFLSQGHSLRSFEIDSIRFDKRMNIVTTPIPTYATAFLGPLKRLVVEDIRYETSHDFDCHALIKSLLEEDKVPYVKNAAVLGLRAAYGNIIDVCRAFYQEYRPQHGSSRRIDQGLRLVWAVNKVLVSGLPLSGKKTTWKEDEEKVERFVTELRQVLEGEIKTVPQEIECLMTALDEFFGTHVRLSIAMEEMKRSEDGEVREIEEVKESVEKENSEQGEEEGEDTKA